MSIFIVIIHRHIIHCKCLRISLRQFSLYWLAFTGTLNLLTHSHSSFILIGVIIIIIIIIIINIIVYVVLRGFTVTCSVSGDH